MINRMVSARESLAKDAVASLLSIIVDILKYFTDGTTVYQHGHRSLVNINGGEGR
jgi:hypothetical protein